MINPLQNNDSVVHGSEVIEYEKVLVQQALDEWNAKHKEKKVLHWQDLPISDMDVTNILELQKLIKECREYCLEFDSTGVLIHEDSFVEYIREEIYDSGQLPRTLPWWIEDNILWEGVAEDLASDYEIVVFSGAKWYLRVD